MEIKTIPLSLVVPSPMNPRKTFSEEALQELADNIEAQGLLQPITVRPIRDQKRFAVMDGKADFYPQYEIVCGERRFRAMSLLNDKWAELDCVAPEGSTYNRFSEIAAIVRDLSDDEAFDAMITENLQRKDVDPLEEAYAFNELVKKGKTAEEIASRFGKSPRFVIDRIKLNNLIPELMLALKDEKMTLEAAKFVCKLDDEAQKKFYKYKDLEYGVLNKKDAENFANTLFMNIDRAPWSKEDPDFAGGCGRRCSACHLNTANYGCLFYEMNSKEAGRCTDRAKFDSKRTAYAIKAVEAYADELVRKGSPLEDGKMVIIDKDNLYVSPSNKAWYDEVYKRLRGAGYEIVKASEVFDGKCYYQADDERLANAIEQHLVYRCLPVFAYDELDVKPEWQYLKGCHTLNDSTSKGASTAPLNQQSVEAMSLVQQRQRLKERANEKIAEKLRQMCTVMEEAKRVGELSDEEQFVFDLFIFTLCGHKMLERYGHKGCGKPKDLSFIEIVKQNRADRNMWIRDFIREICSTPDIMYNPLYRYGGAKVLEQWKPDEYSKAIHEINVKLTKSLAKNSEKLSEIGYGTDGKPLPNDTAKSDTPKTTHTEIGKQYEEMKAKHPDAVLLFDVGDFYEAIREDAPKVAEVLGLVQTTRNNEPEVAFPKEALDQYLPRLVRTGLRVAICEQLAKSK